MLLSEAGWGNQGGPPFDDIAAETLNPAYWQEVDVRLRHVNDRGIVAGLALAWGDKGRSERYAWKRLPTMEARLRYARYIVARYSSFDVYFLVSGEWHAEVNTTHDATEESIKHQFVELGNCIRTSDPHSRMIGIHPMTAHGSVREFVATPWMSFGDYQQNYRDLHGRILESRSENLPVVNSEYAYFLRDQNGDELVDKDNSFDLESIRHASWDIAMAGGYLVTGFGTTYFGGNRDPGPFNLHAETNDPWEKDIQHLQTFFTAIPWWTLQPHDESIKVPSIATPTVRIAPSVPTTALSPVIAPPRRAPIGSWPIPARPASPTSVAVRDPMRSRCSSRPHRTGTRASSTPAMATPNPTKSTQPRKPSASKSPTPVIGSSSSHRPESPATLQENPTRKRGRHGNPTRKRGRHGNPTRKRGPSTTCPTLPSAPHTISLPEFAFSATMRIDTTDDRKLSFFREKQYATTTAPSRRGTLRTARFDVGCLARSRIRPDQDSRVARKGRRPAAVRHALRGRLPPQPDRPLRDSVARLPADRAAGQSRCMHQLRGLRRENDAVFARNFDWAHPSTLVLFTDPPGGYASAAMVDLYYLGLNELQEISMVALRHAPGRPLCDHGRHERMRPGYLAECRPAAADALPPRSAGAHFQPGHAGDPRSRGQC